MHKIDGDKLTRFILSVNGSIFLLLGIFGLFYHFLMAAACFLMATILFIVPFRSLASKNKTYLYLYYLLFVILILLVVLTIVGAINTYS